MRFCCLVIMTCLSVNVCAQSTGGSVYSLYGIGELVPMSNELNRGMGFAGIAINSPYYVNLINSAGNSRAGGYFTHIFNTGLYYNSTQYETNDISENKSNGGLTHLNFWFRLNDRFTSSFGVMPLSNLGYSVNRDNVVGDQGIGYDVLYEGEGGINRFYLNNSIQLAKNLSLGLNLSAFLGTLRKREIAVTQAQAENFIVQNNLGIIKGNIDFGLSYVIDLPKIDIGLGLIYDDATTLRAARFTQLTNSLQDFIFQEMEGELDYILPQKIGFGVSLESEKVILAADVEYNEWSRADIENVAKEDLRDTYRFSTGIDFTPDRRGVLYSSRMSYRAGFYIENSYLKFEDTDFNRWGVTAGLSLPLSNGNVLTLSYHNKNYGTLQNNLIREATNEITLDLTLRNIWFIKRKFE